MSPYTVYYETYPKRYYLPCGQEQIEETHEVAEIEVFQPGVLILQKV